MRVRRVDSRCALLYEWLRYRVLYVCYKVVIFWLKNTTGVLVILTHTCFLISLVSFVFFSFCARSGFSVYFSLTTFDGSSVRSCFAR